LLTAAAALIAIPCHAAEPTVDHSPWDHLLRQYVTEDLVDYEGFKREPSALERYLESLREVNVETLGSREAQLAFWINAYNACVIKGVLDHYPLHSVKSVKGFFDAMRYRVAGRELTLNGIEAQGRALGDVRIHFALVCASSSCPSLRAEAYQPRRLEQQLIEEAKRFLEDPQRGLRLEGSTLWASRIFKWYAKDFVSERLTPASLLSAVLAYLPWELQASPRERLALKWIEYDWTLNDQAIQRTSQHTEP